VRVAERDGRTRRHWGLLVGRIRCAARVSVRDAVAVGGRDRWLGVGRRGGAAAGCGRGCVAVVLDAVLQPPQRLGVVLVDGVRYDW
jgi:hypothetical protein